MGSAGNPKTSVHSRFSTAARRPENGPRCRNEADASAQARAREPASFLLVRSPSSLHAALRCSSRGVLSSLCRAYTTLEGDSEVIASGREIFRFLLLSNPCSWPLVDRVPNCVACRCLQERVTQGIQRSDKAFSAFIYSVLLLFLSFFHTLHDYSCDLIHTHSVLHHVKSILLRIAAKCRGLAGRPVRIHGAGQRHRRSHR